MAAARRGCVHGRSAHELLAFQRRLDRQADATRELREHVYRLAGLESAATILDVGCGSGRVSQDLRQWDGAVTAIDIDAAMVRRARHGTDADVLQADGACLPFADGAFDAVVCNLVLLWAPDPDRLVAEMARIVRPGGVVVASMEPDYGGKVHWPQNPLVDAVFQGQGVERRGGDPNAGRKLRQRFVRAGLVTDVGISNAAIPTTQQDLDNLQRHRGHYRRLLREAGFGASDIDAWEKEYLEALEAGVEMCFLPMFYAVGRKPGGDVRA